MENFKNQFEISFKKHEQKLGANNFMFLKRIFDGGIKKYENRIEAIDFVGKNHVLDAGCGFGQWSLALATKNKKVSACDISSVRTDFLVDFGKSLGISNIDVATCELNQLPYENQTFDAIFCYSVIFLTPWKESLKEFVRVLKPGGKIYLNANGIGWYCFLWNEQNNATADYDPKAVVAKTLADTLLYEREGVYNSGMSLVVEPNQMKEEFAKLGFTNVEIASEGQLHINKNAEKPTPFFKGEYYGLTGIYELVASK